MCEHFWLVANAAMHVFQIVQQNKNKIFAVEVVVQGTDCSPALKSKAGIVKDIQQPTVASTSVSIQADCVPF